MANTHAIISAQQTTCLHFILSAKRSFQSQKLDPSLEVQSKHTNADPRFVSRERQLDPSIPLFLSSPTCRILTLEGLDKHVQALVTVLISSSGEKVKSVLQIEIIVAVKVTPDKVMDAILGHCVQILELVHCLKLDDVETVGQHTIYCPLWKMLRVKHVLGKQ